MRTLHLALWESEKEIEIQFTNFHRYQNLLLPYYFGFLCERVIGLFRGGETLARCLGFILVL